MHIEAKQNGTTNKLAKWSPKAIHHFHRMILLTLLCLVTCSPHLLHIRILGERWLEILKHKSWAFFLLTKQPFKTTTICWSNENNNGRFVLGFGKTPPLIFVHFLPCSIIGIIHIHTKEKQNNTILISKLLHLHKTRAIVKETPTNHRALL